MKTRTAPPAGVQRLLPVLLLGFFTAALAVAQTPVPPEPWDDLLSLEFWSIADRIIHGDTPVEQRLLREAQYTISGMIYGFTFVYMPEYPARGVERYYLLEPVQTIRWGDPRLTVREIRDDRDTLYGLIDYTLDDLDRRRLAAWRNSDIHRAAGRGSGPLQSGLDGKILAVEEAVHQAIRDYLRGRSFNRPREVSGSLVFREAPRIRTIRGTYEAEVEILLRVAEIVPWVTF